MGRERETAANLIVSCRTSSSYGRAAAASLTQHTAMLLLSILQHDEHKAARHASWPALLSSWATRCSQQASAAALQPNTHTLLTLFLLRAASSSDAGVSAPLQAADAVAAVLGAAALAASSRAEEQTRAEILDACATWVEARSSVAPVLEMAVQDREPAGATAFLQAVRQQFTSGPQTPLAAATAVLVRTIVERVPSASTVFAV